MGKHKYLEQYLRCMTRDNPNQWSKWLALTQWWYNTNYYTSTRATPYEVLYKLKPSIHIPYLLRDCALEAIDDFLTEREDMLRVIKDKLYMTQNKMSQLANKKCSDREFKFDDYLYTKLQPYKQKSIA